jgi:adenylate cyclase class IV
MKRELKIKVNSLAKLEKQIMHLGGKLIKEDTQEYTYFNQPEGHVLKLTKKREGTFKTVLEAHDGKFTIVSSDLVDDVQKTIAELSTEYGIKRQLTNHRKVYVNGDEEQSLNNIENVGQFLIIKSDSPTLDSVVKLGIHEPEIITVSFDNL